MNDGSTLRNSNFPTADITNRIRRLVDHPLLWPRKEPLLEDVMSDPIIRQLIAADNLSEPDVRRTIKRAQSGLRLR